MMQYRFIPFASLWFLLALCSGCTSTTNRLDTSVADESVIGLSRGLPQSQVESLLNCSGELQLDAILNDERIQCYQYTYLQPWNKYDFVYRAGQLLKIVRSPEQVFEVRQTGVGSDAMRRSVGVWEDPDDRVQRILESIDLQGETLRAALEQDASNEQRRRSSESWSAAPLLPLAVPAAVIGAPVLLVAQGASALRNEQRLVMPGSTAKSLEDAIGDPEQIWIDEDQELRLYGSVGHDESGDDEFDGFGVIVREGQVMVCFTSRFVNDAPPTNSLRWKRVR